MRSTLLRIGAAVALTLALVGADVVAQEGPSTLRVLTYNIRHGVGMDGKLDLERIAAVIAASRPDLVALQEIDRNCTRSGDRDLAAELAGHLDMEHRFGAFMDFQGGEYGLAVLSRIPVRNTIRHPLPDGAEPRCALEVQVQAEGWKTPISFVSVHNDWTRADFRSAQIRALLQALETRKNPVILAGDFNGQRPDPSMKILREAGWQVLEKGGENTWPADQPKVEIDFVVTRGISSAPISHSVLEERIASDHRPVLAVLALP